jgi:hypothetical protein
MDFTYFVALALSIIIGFASALVFIAVRGRSYLRLAGFAVIAAVAADFALLIDWSHANQMTAAFLVTDAAFFAVYGLIGCFVGALPVLGLRGLYRRVRRSRTNSIQEPQG